MSNGMNPLNGVIRGANGELYDLSELITTSRSILGALQGVSQGGGIVIEDNLESDSSEAALSARMGKELAENISEIVLTLNGIAEDIQNRVVVEDSLGSDSSEAALSARMGKELLANISGITSRLNDIAEDVENKVIVEDSLESDSPLNALSARQGKKLAEKLVRYTGTVELTNTLEYPFNDSLKTITFPAAFSTVKYYLVAYEILSATVEGITYAGRVANSFVSGVCISDKLQNGCKIEFSGAATNVTLEYVIAEAV